MFRTETLETLAERLARLEKAVAEMRLQLSQLVDASIAVGPKNRQTADTLSALDTIAKRSEAEILQKMREHLGIADIQLMPLEELRKRMARHGIRAEDNEFSRAIIKEREK
ncbi:MAG: hypothetical protein OXI24_08120 [Candidatus Poribacteria bacterium]|nr:hypothetical protein [Candidatus Poribacteria bacterium]